MSPVWLLLWLSHWSMILKKAWQHLAVFWGHNLLTSNCACPLVLSAVFALYEWWLSLDCFSHTSSVLIGQLELQLQRCSSFIWVVLGWATGLLRPLKNVVSGRGRACNHLVYCERKGEIVYLHLFKILFSLPCPKLPVTCCSRISYPYLYFVWDMG